MLDFFLFNKGILRQTLLMSAQSQGILFRPSKELAVSD